MKQIPFPDKKYQIIYADPPWSYQNGGVTQGGVDKEYPTMKLEDIKKLPVNELADDTCVLMMWATFPQLPEALEVIKAWGFKYKTLGFSWLKTNKDGSPFFGIGYYAKSNQEVCLLAVKGKAHSLVKSNSVSSFVSTGRTKHSEKPQIFRDKIIELFGDIPRVELFARQKTEGWDVWGNEVRNALLSLRLDYEVHEGLKRDLSQLLSYWSTYPNKDIHTYHIISVFESCAEHFSSTKHLCSNGGLPAMEDKLSLALMFECQDRYASIDEIMQHDTGYPDIIKLTSILSGLVLLNQLEATVNDDGIVVYRLTEFGSRYAEMMLAPLKR